ncbi:MAG: hypothetical protein ACK5PP_10870 [Acidimicrobiales bacterium]
MVGRPVPIGTVVLASSDPVRRGPWIHAAALALVLAATLAVIPRNGSFSSDDGAYAGAVVALRHGHWYLDRPIPVVDQANEGWINSTITPAGPLPYSVYPAYPRLMTAVVGVVHPGVGADEPAARIGLGLRLLPAAGALAAAVTAWLLAARYDRRAAPVAFWLVGTGPLLVNATTLWAHTLSTALAGVACLAALTVIGNPDPPAPVGGRAGRSPWRPPVGATLALAGTIGAGVLLRSDGLLWALAVVATLAVVGRSRSDRVAAVVVLGATATAAVAGRAWAASIRADALPIRTGVIGLDDPGWLAGRLPAAWRLLLTDLLPGPAPFLSITAILAAATAAVILRSHPDHTWPARRLLWASCGLWLVQLVLTVTGRIEALPVSGLVAAWPVPFVLIVAARADRDTVRRLLPLLAPVALMIVAVLATQYTESGGLQWGGRYLSTAFVPLAVAAAVVGHDTVRRHRSPVLALMAAPAVFGLLVSWSLHQRHAGVAEAMTLDEPAVVLTGSPAATRVAWPILPTAVYRADGDSLDPLLADLAARGLSPVTVHGLPDVELDGRAGYRLDVDRGDYRTLVLDRP